MRKNVASQHVAAQMNSRTDGSPLTTGVSAFVTIDGGTQTAGGGTLTHEGNGHWDYLPTQAETNGNHVAFTFVHATGVNQTVNTYPVAFDPSDAVGLGLSRLDAAITTRASQASLDAVDDFVDTEITDIRNRLPAALVSGRMDSSVGAMAAGVITAAAHAAGAIDANAIAADAIGASEFAQAAADKVWATAARALTDKAGFALASAEYTALVNLIWDELTSEGRTAGSYGQKLKDLVLTAAGRVDVGQWLGSAPNALVSGDVPANVRAFLAGALTSAAFAVDAIDAVALKADAVQEIADGLLDRASAVEGFTVRQALRLFAAALVGKADGLATTTAHYRDVADTKNRITATVDADGNRTAVTLDAS